MKYIFLLCLFSANLIFSQSIDDSISLKTMQKDLSVFKSIRHNVNSGLYKYRSKEQIDSIYKWAENKIKKTSTYRDFFNIIIKLTDYEGSCHNSTLLPNKMWDYLKNEKYGYFPYPIISIEGKWIINYQNGNIPLGSEIISINKKPISQIINEIQIYSSTDGINKTGKKNDIKSKFYKYYRYYYGLQKNFEVDYIEKDFSEVKTISINSVSFIKAYKNKEKKYGKSFPNKTNHKYEYNKINSKTGKLTINSFDIGIDEQSKEHKKYRVFLDSVFNKIKLEKVTNLIIDVRGNAGGSDPNDLVTYSYLTQRSFKENKEAFINFEKIPLIKYYNIKIPKFIRPLVVGKHNQNIQKIFPEKKNGKYYQKSNSDYNKIRKPNKNAFDGGIYLLINSETASAASLFAAMVTGNKNSKVIGEESVGGYYGHNGHTEMEYKLPKSKIVTKFFIVNLKQDVPKKENQFYNRGIIPDYIVNQNYKDFIKHEDTQLDFTMKYIENNTK